MSHPQVIEGSQAVIGKMPGQGPLWRWQERYPDGTVHTFEEVWVTAKGTSGTRYGGIQVREVTAA